MKSKVECPTTYAVCYYALKDAIEPLKESILACFDEIYHVDPSEVIDDNFSVAGLLGIAGDVAEEIESVYPDVVA